MQNLQKATRADTSPGRHSAKISTKYVHSDHHQQYRITTAAALQLQNWAIDQNALLNCRFTTLKNVFVKYNYSKAL